MRKGLFWVIPSDDGKQLVAFHVLCDQNGLVAAGQSVYNSKKGNSFYKMMINSAVNAMRLNAFPQAEDISGMIVQEMNRVTQIVFGRGRWLIMRSPRMEGISVSMIS